MSCCYCCCCCFIIVLFLSLVVIVFYQYLLLFVFHLLYYCCCCYYCLHIARCVCELGKEYNTETERCEELDECQSDAATCHNGGQCIDGRDSYSCICTLMYTGINCSDINAVSLMIVLVVVILFMALVALPFVLWLLFRFVSQR